MLLASSITRRLAGDHTARRRRREFTPSISESASRLEDRALLSAAGGPAHAAAAHHLADTAAGQHVTAMFESILHTAPTQQQVTQWVQKIRAGTSINVLKRQLTTEARLQAATANASVASVSSSSVRPTRTRAAATSLPAGATSSVVGSVNRSFTGNSGVRQVPIGVAFSVGSPGILSQSVSFTTGTATPTRRIPFTGFPTGTRITGTGAIHGLTTSTGTTSPTNH